MKTRTSFVVFATFLVNCLPQVTAFFGKAKSQKLILAKVPTKCPFLKVEVVAAYWGEVHI